MRFWIVGLILFSFLLLTVPAAALVPDISVNSSAEWLVAGSGESATITVEVQNSGTPLPGLGVAFSVDAAYGSITPTSGVTDSDGRATATFVPGTRSGDAWITARVTYPDGETTGTVEEVSLQRIDHAAPYTLAGLEYAAEATVGEETDITVRLADRYGNPIDNRNTAESIVFSVGSAEGTAGFVNGEECVPTIPREVNDDGAAIATLRVCERAGENIVVIDSPGPIADRYISIFGVANGAPANISCIMSPSGGSPPSVPADGKSNFSFTYTLFDQYGNPTQGQQLWVTTTVGGEDKLLTTSSSGQVSIAYGPKETARRVTITATAAVNASVTTSQEVEFTSTDPVNMLLTANPQTMPSRDVKPDSVAAIRAKVMDIKGNPVAGETVAFTLLSFDNGTYIQTEAPQLGGLGVGVPVSNSTNDDGYAVVQFTPGAFTTDRGNPGYDPTATGTCTLEAAWGNVTRTIVLTWKNYPYLSVETSVSPETVPVNGTIDTTIRLRGDGWALQPDPIDVVLVIDRSTSMDGTDVSPTRLGAAKVAAKTFVAQMDPSKDQIGVVSYCEYPTVDLSLTYDHSTVNSIIDGLSTYLYTATRKALHTSIQEMIAHRNSDPDAVQAIILMTDGEFNYYGDPLARGTGYDSTHRDSYRKWYEWYPYPYPNQYGSPRYTFFSGLNGTRDAGLFTKQNLSIYANDNDIRLYTISFSDDIHEGSMTWNTLEILAEATGGKHYHAVDGDELTQVYTDIAGELKVEAGVNTTMDVIFENVEVNSTPMPGDDVFDYVYADDISTRIYSANDTFVFINNETRDDTLNWMAGRTLHFDVGTVRLNQVWETTFRLKVLEDGNINIFGPGSAILFNDGTDTLDLPDLFVTAVPDLTNTGVETGTLDIADLRCTGSGPYLDFLPLAWDLAYTGVHEVTEDIYFQADGVSWIYVDSRTAASTDPGDDCQIDVRGLPAGDYAIRVRATAPDAPGDEEILVGTVPIGFVADSYIRIR